MAKQSFQEDFVEPHQVEEYSDKAKLFVGNVYHLSDKKHWRFSDDPNGSHPGACIAYHQSSSEAKLLKGTSQHPGRRLKAYVEVQPDSDNGLTKTTYFAASPTYSFRSKVIELAHRNRRAGRLSEPDLKALFAAVAEFLREDD